MVKPRTNPLTQREVPLGNLLSAATRVLIVRLDAGLAEAGFTDLRAAHAPVLQAIDGAGSRMTDLAARASMTKQAMRELVQHLEQHGYVTVGAHPTDGRAKLVTLTKRGWRAIDVGVGIIDRYDAWLEKTVGKPAMRDLRLTLERIISRPVDA